jgi:hypothetical protein
MTIRGIIQKIQKIRDNGNPSECLVEALIEVDQRLQALEQKKEKMTTFDTSEIVGDIPEMRLEPDVPQARTVTM